MQITAARLKHVLALAETCYPKKYVSLPITGNVLVHDGMLMATNLERYIVVDLPEAEDMAFCVPFKPLADYVKHIPNNVSIQLEDQATKLSITTERGSIVLAGADPGEFPPCPNMDGSFDAGAINGNIFLQGLQAVAHCAAADETLPVLTGVHVTLGEGVTMAGADGFRLGVYPTSLSIPAPNSSDLVEPKDRPSLIIPRETVLALSKVWKTARKDLPPMPSDNPDLPTNLAAIQRVVQSPILRLAYYLGKAQIRFQIRFQSGEFTLYSQLLAGTYLDYSKLIQDPKDLPHKVRFDAGEMRHTVQQLTTIAVQTNGIIRLEWHDTTMKVSARTEDNTEANNTIEVTTEGEPGKIALNHRYLSDYLSGKEGQVLMEASEPSAPLRFTHPDLPICVIMPMFVQWD